MNYDATMKYRVNASSLVLKMCIIFFSVKRVNTVIKVKIKNNMYLHSACIFYNIATSLFRYCLHTIIVLPINESTIIKT